MRRDDTPQLACRPSAALLVISVCLVVTGCFDLNRTFDDGGGVSDVGADGLADGGGSEAGRLCGNGSINSGETCDGTNLDSVTCQKKGFTGGALACHPVTCQFVTTGCYKLIDPDGFDISPAPRDLTTPALARGKGKFLVVFQTPPHQNDLYGVLLDTGSSSTAPQKGSLITVSTASGGQGASRIAFDGTKFFVVWDDTRTARKIYGVPVTADGTVGQEVLVTGTQAVAPKVTFANNRYFVVWEDYATWSGPDHSIAGVRLAADLSKVDSANIGLRRGFNSQRPALAAGNNGYLVVWKEYVKGSVTYNWQIRGVLVGVDGAITKKPFSITSGGSDKVNAEVAFDGTRYLVVYSDKHKDTGDIHGVFIQTDGTLDTGGKLVISSPSDRQEGPRLAFLSTNYLVVWTDHRSGSYADIYGARVTRSGKVQDPKGIPITTRYGVQQGADVAQDGKRDRLHDHLDQLP